LADLKGTKVGNSFCALVQDYINYLEKLLPLLERYLERIKPFLARGSKVVDQTRNSAREFQKLFDWDFDSFLLEDVPAAMDFVKEKTAPADGKVLAIGHSMGGILLYCLLSTKGEQSQVASSSSLDDWPGHCASDWSQLELLRNTRLETSKFARLPLYWSRGRQKTTRGRARRSLCCWAATLSALNPTIELLKRWLTYPHDHE
jgi:hypothetical protein